MPDAKSITAKQLRELVKTFPWDDWSAGLRDGLTQEYRELVQAEGARAAETHGVSFDQNDPFLQRHMTGYIGERITQLNRTTQKDVTQLLRRVLADDTTELSAGELQTRILDVVRERFGDYEAYRALRIARSESAIAYNHGGVLGHVQAGIESFDVHDGTDDEACAAANGQVWSADQCLANPIAHPNCVRAFGPHVADDEADAA